jgi:CBS domain-containing protein
MITIKPRPRSGVFLESTNAEAFGVPPGEDRLVKETMNLEVTPVDALTSVKDAVETMRNRSLHIVIVCRDGEPISALTEYDVAISEAACEGPSSSVTLDDIVKKRVEIRCYEDALLAAAIPAMAVHCTRHVPVVNAQGNLVGALSMVNALEVLPQDVAARWLKKLRQLSTESLQPYFNTFY